MEPEITPLEKEKSSSKPTCSVFRFYGNHGGCMPKRQPAPEKLSFRAPSGCLDSKPRSLASNRKDQHLGMMFVVSKIFYGG